MPGAQLFQYQSVVNFWKTAKNEKIDTFFSPDRFFTKHATLEFFLGENSSDGCRRTLLLSEDSVKSIHTELENLTSLTLPMMTKSQTNPYRNVVSTFIDSKEAYYKINKDMKKYNKKIQEHSKLNMMKAMWEAARNKLKENEHLFVAVDVESYERDHSCILEVGWSMFDSKKNLFMDRHYCASEYRHLRNGQFVADRKDAFIFGKTVWDNLTNIGKEFVKDLTEEKDRGVVFVGHDIKMDVKYLESMKVDVKGDINPIAYFDTAEMNAARVGKPNERLSLGRLLDELDIENYCLHNAGNDAHYTLCLFLELCRLPLQPSEDATASQPASSSD